MSASSFQLLRPKKCLDLLSVFLTHTYPHTLQIVMSKASWSELPTNHCLPFSHTSILIQTAINNTAQFLTGLLLLPLLSENKNTGLLTLYAQPRAE